jgi:UDP-glucuronate decarboxylase
MIQEEKEQKEEQKENTKKVILVTGGAGFLGRHLCGRLLAESPENQVICVDNLITGSEENIRDFLRNPRFLFLEWDICQPMEFSELHEIYHLACIASPDKYKEHSIATLDTCFIGTKNILELAREHKAKVVFTSTSEVYGDPLVHPQVEEYYGNVNTVGERSCYDEGKRVAETLMYEYRRVYGLDTRIVRLFNTYGPYMNLDDGRVITNFIRQMKRGEELVVYGDGTQTRSFCYVSDTIDGIVAMMNRDVGMGPANIGNPYCEISLNQLVEVFRDFCSDVEGGWGVRDIRVRYIAGTENDPRKRNPNIEKAKEWLDFSPQVDLVDGLKMTFAFYF